MELRLEPATRLPRPPWWVVLVVLVWIGGILLTSSAFAGADDAASSCTLRRLTGVPCPGCGGTRGVRSIADGRPQDAFALNPGLFFLLTLWLALFVRRLVTGTRIAVRFTPRGRRIAWVVAVVLFALWWGYVIWRQGIDA